jgi:ubiquinone/menaquinone biosynthesis C-methylase UbiE
VAMAAGPRTWCERCGPPPTRGWTSTPPASTSAKRGTTCLGSIFVHGDAENLPFPDESFDAVVTGDASHIYPHFERFLAEVTRVLRRGGHFLYADFRNRDGFPAWETALAESGMRQVSEKMINEPVLRGYRRIRRGHRN